MGPRSAVLYSAKVGDNARLGALTLVMKGEHIPAGTSWAGCPGGAGACGCRTSPTGRLSPATILALPQQPHYKPRLPATAPAPSHSPGPAAKPR
jgi:carbonic anhydrase/acetyltransferase-like protein (isoleucine patch superfamily)